MTHSINVQIPDRAELVIRRPDGVVETVVFPGAKSLTAVLFANIKKATAAAGRGECLSYRNITKSSVAVMSNADQADLASEQIGKMMRHGE